MKRWLANEAENIETVHPKDCSRQRTGFWKPSWHLGIEQMHQALSSLSVEERPPWHIKSSENMEWNGTIWRWVKYYETNSKNKYFFYLLYFNKWAPHLPYKVSKFKYFPCIRMTLYATFMDAFKKTSGPSNKNPVDTSHFLIV